jgi:hypothetical protein
MRVPDRIIAGSLAFALALFPALTSAQSVSLPGFSPGVFQSRAAIDANIPPAPITIPIFSYNPSNTTTPSTTVASYGPLHEGDFSSTVSSTINYRVYGVPMPIAGTFSNLTVSIPALTTNTWSIALNQNSNNSTALTCSATGPATTCTSAATVTVAAGDIVGFTFCPGTFIANVCTPGSAPTAMSGLQVSMTFTSTNNNETFIDWAGVGNASNSVANYGAPTGTFGTTATESAAETVIPTAGVIDHLYAAPFSSPGSGTYAVTVFQNGSATAITCTITALADCTPDLAHSITVAAGDTISFQTNPSTSPTATSIHASVRFTPTVSGQGILLATATAGLTTNATTVFAPAGTITAGLTEASHLALAPSISGGFTIKNLYYCMSTDPGSGKSRTITLRNGTGSGQSNTAVTGVLTGATSQTVNCGGSAQPGFSGSASLSSIATGTFLNWQSSESGTPAAMTFFRLGAVVTSP